MSPLGRGRLLFGLAWQGVRRRPLTTTLTALSVALGIGLVVAVETIRASASRSFGDAARGYDVILGPAAGSPLQAVLATLFHVEAPAGTIPWSLYEEVRDDPRVEAAIPYAVGDTYRGHHVVGTDPALFALLADGAGKPLGEGVHGRMMRPERFEAVVGHAAARATGLKVGDAFQVTHGFTGGGHAHAETWEVVGVLRPTGMPHDRALYIPIRTFFAVAGHGPAPPPASEASEPGEAAPDDEEHDHAHDGDDGHDHDHAHGEDHDHDHDHAHDEDDAHDHDHDHAHDEDHDHDHEGEDADHHEHEDGHADDPHDHGDEGHEDHPPAALSSIGVRLRSPGLRLTYLQEFRTGERPAQAILPTDEVRKLLAIVGDVNRGVRLVAWLVAIVAAVGILVGLYNTIQGRRREIAVLRVLGARPHHVFGVILLEALVIGLLGGAIGLVLGYGGVSAAAPLLLDRFGVRVAIAPGLGDLALLGAVGLLALLAGLLPAWRGLATPVAPNLEPRA